MKIEKNGPNELIITGNIKSIEDSANIKHQITSLINNGAADVTLKIVDSFSMTSSVIGHLLKLVHRDNIRLSILIKDKRLYELLNELSLVPPFNVRMI